MMTAVVSGVLSSFLFLGVGARLAMYLLGSIVRRPLDFSIEGNIALLVFSTSIGIIGGFLFALIGSGSKGPQGMRGGHFGLILFVVLIPMLPDALREEALALNQYIPLAITLFGLLLMGFGSVMELLYRMLIDMSPGQSRGNLAHAINPHHHQQQQGVFK